MRRNRYAHGQAFARMEVDDSRGVQIAYRKSIMSLSHARNTLFAMAPETVGHDSSRRYIHATDHTVRLASPPMPLGSPCSAQTRSLTRTMTDIPAEVVSCETDGVTAEARIITRIRMCC